MTDRKTAIFNAVILAYRESAQKLQEVPVHILTLWVRDYCAREVKNVTQQEVQEILDMKFQDILDQNRKASIEFEKRSKSDG